jgi:hypothetical protein
LHRGENGSVAGLLACPNHHVGRKDESMQGFCKTCIAALFLIPLTISAAAAEWGLRRLRDGIRVFMRLCHEQRCDNLVGTTATLAACRDNSQTWK